MGSAQVHGLRILHGETREEAWRREFGEEYGDAGDGEESGVGDGASWDPISGDTSGENPTGQAGLQLPAWPADGDEWMAKVIAAARLLHPAYRAIDIWDEARQLSDEEAAEDTPIRLDSDDGPPCLFLIWPTTVTIVLVDAGAAFLEKIPDEFGFVWNCFQLLASLGCAVWDEMYYAWIDTTIPLAEARGIWQ